MASVRLTLFRPDVFRAVQYIVVITAWGAAFMPVIWQELIWALDMRDPVDFEIFAIASQRAWAGENIYSVTDICEGCNFRYSPLFAYAFLPLATFGAAFWGLLHFAVLAALPWRTALTVLFLWPFWWDVGVGSNLIFIVVIAYHAMAGRQWAIWATLAAALLVPRPLMIPIAAWMLWQHPRTRGPFVGGVVVTLLFATATGYLIDWAGVLLGSGSEIGKAFNIGPSAILGAAWIPVGLVVGAWLVLRGRIGWAALAVSPYVIPYYLLVPLIDMAPRQARRSPRGEPHLMRKSDALPVTTQRDVQAVPSPDGDPC